MEPTNHNDPESQNQSETIEKLMYSDKELEGLTAEEERKCKQLDGRYQEARGKIQLKLTATVETFGKLQGEIKEVGILTEFMGLQAKEFSDAKEEYSQKIKAL